MTWCTCREVRGPQRRKELLGRRLGSMLLFLVATTRSPLMFGGWSPANGGGRIRASGSRRGRRYTTEAPLASVAVGGVRRWRDCGRPSPLIVIQTGNRRFVEDVTGTDGRTASTRVRMDAGGRRVPTHGGSCRWLCPAGVAPARHQDADQIETVADVVNYSEENKDQCVIVKQGVHIRRLVEKGCPGTIWVIARQRVGGAIQSPDEILLFPNRSHGWISIHLEQNTVASPVMSAILVWRRVGRAKLLDD